MNHRCHRRAIAVLGGMVGLLGWQTSATASQTIPDLAAVRQRLATLSVPFVPNAGQWDSQAAFAAQVGGGTLFVSREGQLVYRFPGMAARSPERFADANKQQRAGCARLTPKPDRAAPCVDRLDPAPQVPGWVLTETLVDSTGRPIPAAPQATLPLPGQVSYAIGNDESTHRDGLATYERVSLGEVYPGIAVELRATGGNAEKIFTVAPRHDPRAIRIVLAGAETLELGAAGELLAHTGNGPVTYTAPIAYQEDAGGQRTAVPVRYALDTATHQYGFTVGAYDAERRLTIDPLLQSTYLGGGSNDQTTALAIHPVTGEVYVAGYTTSTNFPKVAGAEQTTNGGSQDAFVTRLNATLTTRLQSTYLGGNGSDAANALAIHPATGEVYVAGYTTSTNFPKVAGAEQTILAGAQDAFVTRLNAALTTRLQSTYLGGSSGNEQATALAIHPATGDVYVAGYTDSTDFPKVAGAEQTTFAGNVDGFVTQLNAALTTRLQSTYLGGSGSDLAFALAIHPATGDVYVAGYTTSTNFPKVAGAEQTILDGNADGFVTRLNAALTTRLQSTYLGGSSIDLAYALAIHPATGDVYVAGYTDSTDFPKVAGAEQTTIGGTDAFVTRLNAALTIRLQSTYLGGSGYDQATALAIHPATGEVYVAGFTNSTNFPKVAGAEQTTNSGSYDAFVTRLNAALTTRLQSTYLGGSGSDQAAALAIHPATGDVYVTGYTASTDFPKVAGAEQTTLAGSANAFVSRSSFDLLANNAVPNAFSFPPKLNVPPGSQQVSAAAQVLGIVGLVPIGVTGGAFAQYCISSTSACGCDILPFTSSSGTIAINQFVCVRQQAPLGTPAENIAAVVIGGGVAHFVVTTGGALSACSLDVDGNGNIDALTDGLMLLRAMFGLTGTTVTNGATGGGATRTTWAQIQPYLNGNCGTAFVP